MKKEIKEEKKVKKVVRKERIKSKIIVVNGEDKIEVTHPDGRVEYISL